MACIAEIEEQQADSVSVQQQSEQFQFRCSFSRKTAKQ